PITTGGIGDTSLPAVYTAYDPGTGLATTTGNLSGAPPSTCPSNPTLTSQINIAFDGDGRVSSYTDAGGNVATSVYNADGQLATLLDGQGTVTCPYEHS